MKESLKTKLQILLERYEEIAVLLSEPDVIADNARFRTLSIEYNQLAPLVACYKDYDKVLAVIDSAKEMLQESDQELRQLAQEELKEAQQQKASANGSTIRRTTIQETLDANGNVIKTGTTTTTSNQTSDGYTGLE